LQAVRDGKFDWGNYLLVTIGLVFAHATNNLINDYTDHKRGVDQGNYYRTQYGPQPLEQGLMTTRQWLGYTTITGLIAIAAGLPLILQRGLPALILTLIGATFVLFYTWPLKYIGMGEIAVFLIWGPLMIAGSYFVITGISEWAQILQITLISLPYALGPTSVLFGKHIDKSEADRAKKIYTLPVILGEKIARYAVLVMFALMYLLVILFVILGYFEAWMLIVLLAAASLPRPVGMYLKPRPKEKPANLEEGLWPLWFSAASFYHTRVYGMLFVLGLILQILF
ncbi:MAG TPA: prenyltransferase, partial [Anaerolineaceae bacterium]|nr:prenyltransferase [Anaerolineaceae bacterium]